MIKEKIQEAINEQINKELYSSYLYMSMSAYFESINLSGFAKWMYVQVQEELTHAVKFYNYVNEKGGRVILQPIEGPSTEWDSPLAAFENTYEHEQMVTERINKLVDLVIAESDHATNIFLQWFVTEQVEEESSADQVIKQLKLAGDSPGALFMIDRELGQRVFASTAIAGEEGQA